MDWTTESLTALLKERHEGSEWALVFQVPDGTGMNKSRTADAMAMSLWPSRGLDLHGYEIKASRSDWLKEIQDHSKADRFAVYCDFWWIVAAPGIVKPEEMPGSWGLLEPAKTGSGLKVRKGAERTTVKDIGREFLAGLFRTVSRQSPHTELLRAFWRRGYEASQAYHKREEKKRRNDFVEKMPYEMARLKKAVEDFEAASGITLEDYTGGQIGKAVAAVTELTHQRWRIRDMVESLEENLMAARKLQEAMAVIARADD